MANNSSVLVLLNPQPVIKNSEETRGLSAQTLIGAEWPLCWA